MPRMKPHSCCQYYYSANVTKPYNGGDKFVTQKFK